MAAIKNENFKTVQIKVTKNHVIPRFVVFLRHETVWGGFVFCTRSRSPKKVLFTVKYDIKIKKGQIIVILNVFIKFICFSILVLGIVHFLVTHSEERACTIAHTESRTYKSPNTTSTVVCTMLLALQYLKHISTLK